MKKEEAFNIVHQLARMAQVNGDVGDKRDEALDILKELAIPEKDEKEK